MLGIETYERFEHERLVLSLLARGEREIARGKGVTSIKYWRKQTISCPKPSGESPLHDVRTQAVHQCRHLHSPGRSIVSAFLQEESGEIGCAVSCVSRFREAVARISRSPVPRSRGVTVQVFLPNRGARRCGSLRCARWRRFP